MPKTIFLRLGLVVALLVAGAGRSAGQAAVTIDGAQTYQTIDGFGVNANYWSWNDSELQPVLDQLIDQAGMTLFRVIFNEGWETNTLDWNYYNEVYAGPEAEKLWSLMGYLNWRGITNGVMPNFQGYGPSCLVTWPNTLTPGNEDAWAQAITSLLVYARTNRQLQFNLVAPNNEPDIGGEGIAFSTVDQYLTALRALASQLDTNGLSDVRLVGPDRSSSGTNWLPEMLGDPVVMSKLGHFGLHSYSGSGAGSWRVYDFLQGSAYPDRTFWMTEFNVWCDVCEDGVSGTNNWDYFRGTAEYLLYHLADGASGGLVWEAYDSYYPHHGTWSFWGLLAVDNPYAQPRTYTPRKNFYTLAQITKFVRPGARQIDVSGSTDPLFFLAFYHPDSGQITLVGENTGSNPADLGGLLTNLPPVASLDLYYTDRTTNLCHSATFPLTNGAFAATVPGDCVFTLVGFDPVKTAVAVLITNPVNGARFTAPACISIQAVATTSTGTLTSVEFFCGTTNLGEGVSPPYSIAWSNVPPGNYVLSATATNFVGEYGVSPDVRVTVVGAAAQISITPSNTVGMPYSPQQFLATATDALGDVLTPQPAFSWSVSGGGTIDASGLFTAGGGVGGPFTISASVGGLTGTASISITTNLNLAPAALGYTWHSLTASTGNSPQALAPGINDGDLETDVPLFPGGAEDTTNAYEAGGVLWPTPQTINRVIYYNGSYNVDEDGVFAANFGLQFSPDGSTWTAADPTWTISPAYVYNSPSSANTNFTFTGAAVTVRGVRCVGRVHTRKASSWVAFATELQAFAAPVLPTEPNITSQPTNQTAPVGATVSFTVAANGAEPLNYQWQFNGTNLDGAAANTVTLTNVQPTQAGSYSVVVTNAAGSATSTAAILTVLEPPAIAVQPTGQTVAAGAAVQFSVTATGAEPLNYQWQFDGGNLPGATANTLTLTNVQAEQAGGYRAQIINPSGTTNSTVAMLTVLRYPLLLAARTTTDGAFVFTLSGDAGFNYVIEVSTNLAEWTPLSTVSNATGQAEFTDSAVSNSLSRFYRARLTY